MINIPRSIASLHSRLAILVAMSLVLLACAPAPPGVPSSPALADTANSPSRGPKTLRIGIHLSNEPREGIAGWGAATNVSANDMNFIYHAGLTIQSPSGEVLPWVAQRVPSLENGDWNVAADGSMEVTWHLRPDVKWHDGTPLTAKDFVFGTEVRQDKSLAILQTGVEQVSGVSAPDDLTFVVSYKGPFIYAHISPPGQLRAVPTHLLEELYRKGDSTAFANAPYWTSDFVGLGPYRLTDWTLGSSMEATAFDGYFLGRPKIDRLVMRYIGDITVMHVSMVAGELDLVPMGTFQADSFARIKQEYEGAGLGTAIAVLSGTRNYKFQFRYPEEPWAQDVRVRRALIHLLDRQALADALLYGQTAPADATISPTNPVFSLLKERGLPHYGFDPTEGNRLLVEAGWQRGVDGSYRNAAGQPFTINVMSRDLPLNVQETQAVAAQLRAAGLNATTSASGKGAVSIAEQEATNRGLFAFPLREGHTAFSTFTTAQIATAANGWKGNNFGSYTSPSFDGAYERSLLSFDASERSHLIADFLKILADDVATIDLYYTMSQNTVVFRKTVHGPGLVFPEQLAVAWNIHTWTMD